MQIILKEDVIGLGYKNDIVEVKNGYGRNYLIPTGKAVIASPSAKKVLAENLRQQAHKIAAIKAAAEEKAAKMEGVSLIISAKVSATGQTYGSVGAAHVAAELQALGHDVDRKIVILKDIKAVGDYVAVVKLHKEVSVEIPVKVVAEGATVTEEAPKAAETPAVEEAPAAVVEEAPAEADETTVPATETPAE